MIPVSTTLWHGLLMCVPFTLFAVGTFWTWPRLWLHSLPPDIAALAGPKTPVEETRTRYLLVAYVSTFPGLSVASTLIAARQAGVDLTFAGALVHLYGIWVVVHVWDFAAIDCTHALLIDPARPPIAGTEGARGYGDYRFHFRSMIKAILMSAFFVVPVSAVLAAFW
jgi:hypothetical protein